MMVLLDTCALLWLVHGEGKLSEQAWDTIGDSRSNVSAL